MSTSQPVLNCADQIPSPAYLIFLETLESNLRVMVQMSGDVGRLRPHCKTHKMAAITRRELQLGITKHKAATLAEAEMLALEGVRDIVLAYNLVGPNIGRAVEFRAKFPDVFFAVTADDADAVRQLGEAITQRGQTIGVVLDINPGRDRTGLPAGPEAAALYRQIASTPGITAEGFHLYDGHVHQADLAERRTVVLAEWEKVAALRDDLEQQGLPVPRIISGGTPTFPVYAELSDPAIELSPGTCVFHDANYGEGFPDLAAFRPAAQVLTRVVSRPKGNRVTFDLGTKAVASDPPMGQRVVFPALPDAKQVLQNEEHLVVETDRAGEFRPGDWLLAIPRHVCPTSALYKEAIVIGEGEIVDRWEVTARDRCLTI